MTQEPDTAPDWALIEAAKRLGSGNVWPISDLRDAYRREYNCPIHVVADLISKHEQPPVDRKVLCAREAAAEVLFDNGHPIRASDIRAGRQDDNLYVQAGIQAISLWESGHGA